MGYQGQPGAEAAGAILGQAALENKVKPLLEPEEELLAAIEVRRASRVMKRLWGCMDVTGPGPDLPKKMVIAVTRRRVLILSAHGAPMDEAEGVLWDVPISEVGSVEKRGGINASQVSWSAGGREYTVWANSSLANRLAGALDAAPGGER